MAAGPAILGIVVESNASSIAVDLTDGASAFAVVACFGIRADVSATSTIEPIFCRVDAGSSAVEGVAGTEALTGVGVLDLSTAAAGRADALTIGGIENFSGRALGDRAFAAASRGIELKRRGAGGRNTASLASHLVGAAADTGIRRFPDVIAAAEWTGAAVNSVAFVFGRLGRRAIASHRPPIAALRHANDVFVVCPDGAAAQNVRVADLAKDRRVGNRRSRRNRLVVQDEIGKPPGVAAGRN